MSARIPPGVSSGRPGRPWRRGLLVAPPPASVATRVLVRVLAPLLAPLLAVGCGGRSLGPADAYLLLGPVEPNAAGQAAGTALPLVRQLDVERGPAREVARLAGQGFGDEMVRTVHLVKQLVRGPGLDGRRFPEALARAAESPLCLVIGREGEWPAVAGLAFDRPLRSLRGPDERPGLPWVGLPATLEDDRALVQTLSGRLAAHAATWIVAAGGPPPSAGPAARSVLVEAYRMAMEVISREWRVGRGPGGALPSTAGTLAQRHLFADIRENHAVLAPGDTDPARGRLRPPAELLAEPRVAATVLYRLAQTRAVANRVAGPEVYAPFVAGPLPEGVTGAAVLGPIRNFNAKLFTAWARAGLQGRPPADLVDLVEAYGASFPAERPEVLRIFLVTTYAATVKPGGVSRRAADASAVVAELGGLVEDLRAGRRGLRDAVAAPEPAPAR